MKYYVTYWLPGQSRLFSRPQMAVVNSPEELKETVSKCEKYGYEIKNVISM